jgi:hypothetical protein
MFQIRNRPGGKKWKMETFFPEKRDDDGKLESN